MRYKGIQAAPKGPRPKWWFASKTLAGKIIRHFGGTGATAKALHVSQSIVSNWRWAPVPPHYWNRLIDMKVITVDDVRRLRNA